MMFHHFCLVLLLAVASNGQLPSQPQVAASQIETSSRLSIDNQAPDDNLLPTTGTPNDNLPTEPQNDGESGLEPDSACTQKFAYYQINGKCDSYIECQNFRQAERLCPDGMHFNPDARWPEYPCGYPMDVPCRGRGSLQPSKPTAECPHQYGFFPVVDSSFSTRDRCSKYLMCFEGVAALMDCPFGLAFDPATQRCDWPDLIPSCKDFLGFKCPAPPLGGDGRPLDSVQNYKYSKDECYYFWSCEQGRARLLSCDNGLAFDSRIGRCEIEDLVQCDNLGERSSKLQIILPEIEPDNTVHGSLSYDGGSNVRNQSGPQDLSINIKGNQIFENIAVVQRNNDATPGILNPIQFSQPDPTIGLLDLNRFPQLDTTPSSYDTNLFPHPDITPVLLDLKRFPKPYTTPGPNWIPQPDPTTGTYDPKRFTQPDPMSGLYDPNRFPQPDSMTGPLDPNRFPQPDLTPSPYDSNRFSQLDSAPSPYDPNRLPQLDPTTPTLALVGPYEANRFPQLNSMPGPLDANQLPQPDPTPGFYDPNLLPKPDPTPTTSNLEPTTFSESIPSQTPNRDPYSLPVPALEPGYIPPPSLISAYPPPSAAQPPRPDPRPSYVLPATSTVKPLLTATSNLTSFTCDHGNGYYGIIDQCDSYVKCQGSIARRQICPDGLHFNPKALYPSQYPCAYPLEVKCLKGALKQNPRPTNECPQQYGFYTSADGDCSSFIMCQEGMAFRLACPTGLVFNKLVNACDWPDNVPQCNPSVFKDFACPKSSEGDERSYKYRFGTQCKKYISCQRGHPRLLGCDKGTSFDVISQTCVDSDYVKDCVDVL